MSAAYAMIAYWTAYLKTHYPVEYMAALLTVEASSTEDTMANIQECRRLGIPILPPDINKSKLGFSIELIEEKDDNGNPTGRWVKAIRYGLESISGVGEAVVEEILRRPPRPGEPESAGEPYKNFDDFYHRVDKRKINKSYMEKLIKAGCFDFDIQNRYALLNHFWFNLRGDKEFLGTYEDFLKQKKAKKIKSDTNYRLNPKDYNEDVLCEFEKELFGFYLTYHPYQDLPYTPWHQVNENQQLDMGGKIKSIKKIKTRKGDDMCFLTVETAGGNIDVTVFPKTFKEYQTELFVGNIAIFRGRKRIGENDKVSLIMDKILKARKKKFQVEKPPELEQLAKERKQQVQAAKKKQSQQLTLEDFGEVAVRPDPLAGMFDDLDPGLDADDYIDSGNWMREEMNHLLGQIKQAKNEASASAEKKEIMDLADLFDD